MSQNIEENNLNFLNSFEMNESSNKGDPNDLTNLDNPFADFNGIHYYNNNEENEKRLCAIATDDGATPYFFENKSPGENIESLEFPLVKQEPKEYLNEEPQEILKKKANVCDSHINSEEIKDIKQTKANYPDYSRKVWNSSLPQQDYLCGDYCSQLTSDSNINLLPNDLSIKNPFDLNVSKYSQYPSLSEFQNKNVIHYQGSKGKQIKESAQNNYLFDKKVLNNQSGQFTNIISDEERMLTKYSVSHKPNEKMNNPLNNTDEFKKNFQTTSKNEKMFSNNLKKGNETNPRQGDFLFGRGIEQFTTSSSNNQDMQMQKKSMNCNNQHNQEIISHSFSQPCHNYNKCALEKKSKKDDNYVSNENNPLEDFKPLEKNCQNELLLNGKEIESPSSKNPFGNQDKTLNYAVTPPKITSKSKNSSIIKDQNAKNLSSSKSEPNFESDHLSLQKKKELLFKRWNEFNKIVDNKVEVDLASIKNLSKEALSFAYNLQDNLLEIHKIYIESNNNVKLIEKYVMELLEVILQINDIESTVHWNMNDYQDFFGPSN